MFKTKCYKLLHIVIISRHIFLIIFGTQCCNELLIFVLLFCITLKRTNCSNIYSSRFYTEIGLWATTYFIARELSLPILQYNFLYHRNVLQKAREMGLRTIALSVINSVRRNYPPDAGAHIALSKYTTSKYLCKVYVINKFIFFFSLLFNLKYKKINRMMPK